MDILTTVWQDQLFSMNSTDHSVSTLHDRSTSFGFIVCHKNICFETMITDTK